MRQWLWGEKIQGGRRRFMGIFLKPEPNFANEELCAQKMVCRGLAEGTLIRERMGRSDQNQREQVRGGFLRTALSISRGGDLIRGKAGREGTVSI